MRDFKGMKRQRGRNRNSGSGGGKPQHNTNRAFESNGPDGVKVRGAAQGVYEKYQQLARDAHTAGDRVLAENYLQHAEHYFRVMRAMQPQRPLSEIIGRDQFVSGYDIDFEDDGGGDAIEAEGSDSVDGLEAVDRQDRPPERSRDDYRQSDQRARDDRFRDDRPRDERAQGDRSQNDRPPRSYRDDRARYGRDERPRAESGERPGPDPLVVIEPEATPLIAQPLTAAPTVLRADDGDVSQAPAFLQVRPAESRADVAGEPRPPRRRRAPRGFENAGVAGEATPSPAAEEV